MKRSHIALMLALVLCLALFGCGKEDPAPTGSTPTDATTGVTPDETTAPTVADPILRDPDETQPEETENPRLTVEDFTELLNSETPEAHWIRQAIGCVFGQPEDIDLYYFFYNGMSQYGWDTISQESVDWLESQGYKKGAGLQVMPLDDMEQVLQDVFGISMADVEAGIPGKWRYLQQEKAYCSNHSDVWGGIGGVTVTWVDEYAGGRIDVFYTMSGSYYNTATGEWLDNPDMVLALRKLTDGTYQVLANIEAPTK